MTDCQFVTFDLLTYFYLDTVYVQTGLLFSLIIFLKYAPLNGLWTLFNLHVNFSPTDLILSTETEFTVEILMSSYRYFGELALYLWASFTWS